MTLHEDARRHVISTDAKSHGVSHSEPPRTTPLATNTATLADPVLFGRADELAVLREFVDSIEFGPASLAIVGEVGIGRSKLLEAAAEFAQSSGHLVVSTGGYRSESHIPYAALHQLLLPVTDVVAALSEPSRFALTVALGMETGFGAEPDQIFEAVLAVLRRASNERPVLITIDDPRDLDAASAAALSFVIDHLDDCPMGVLVAAQSPAVTDGRAQSADELLSPAQLGRELRLERLDADASAQLVDTIAPDLPQHARSRVVDQGEGNPLALVEFARGVRAALEADPEALPSVLPSYGNQTFSFEVANLPVATRRAMLLLALSGSGGLGPVTRAQLPGDSLDAAEAAGLVLLDAERVTASFGHPLVASAVVAAASSAERRQAHYFLAEQQSDLERQAFHLSEASDRTDEGTAALLERAGQLALRRGDTNAAMRSLARAAVLSPGSLDRQRRLARAAFVATDVAGDRAMSLRLLNESRQVHEGPGALYAAIAFALEQLIAGADTAAAFRILSNAVEYGDHDWNADDEQLIEAMNTWMLVCWNAGREDYWLAFFGAMNRLRPEVPESLRTLSVAFADTARVSTDERDAVVRMYEQLGGRTDYSTTLQLNTAALFLDLLPLGVGGIQTLIEEGRRGGPTMTLLRALSQMCLYDFGAGRWDEAETLAEEGLAVADANGAAQVAPMFMYVRGLIAGVRGRTEEAVAWLDQVDAIAGMVDAHGVQRFGTHARVLTAQGAADWESAYREAASISAPGELAPFVPMALWVAFELVESAIRTGRVQDARAHHEAMLRADLPHLSARQALLTTGAGALVAGPDEWRSRFEAALAIEKARDWPFDYARVQLAFGARLRKERRTTDARQQLHSALIVFERLGAEPWAARAREELRIAREPIERAGLELELTPQELVVAELAAAGLSNRQIGEQMFLSTRTVSGHLYRIFPKLGITHRSALRDALEKARE